MLYYFLLYKNVNQLYVCIYPLPLERPSHPARSSQSTDLTGLPVLSCRFLLASCFTHGVVLYHLLWIHPTCIRVCILSASLSLSCISTIFLDSTYNIANICYLFFWLASLCVEDSRFIHITTNDPVSQNLRCFPLRTEVFVFTSSFLSFPCQITLFQLCCHNKLLDGRRACEHAPRLPWSPISDAKSGLRIFVVIWII